MGNINWKKAIGTTVNGFLIKRHKRDEKHTYIYVECPYCHKDKWMRSDAIKEGRVISCGCYNTESNLFKMNDIKGKKFGKLKAIKQTDEKYGNGSYVWECECKCGKKVYIDSTSLLIGRRVSCGCSCSDAAKQRWEVDKHLIEFCVENTNVRVITNKKLLSTNTSGCTGVSFDKSRNKWVSQIVFKGKRYYLGRYDKKGDAIEVRKIAENKLHGDFLQWYAKAYPDKWEKLNRKVDKNERI